MTKQTPEEAAAVSVADEVRAELARQRKTAAELASVLGITQHTAGRRLNGGTHFNVLELFLVASWLGLTVEEIARRAEHAAQHAAEKQRVA
ncbi:helix-turn-helix domain-containing protein [Microbacterium sp. K35]|uniref:helix-turn-helix domain-containing protein n=1 Tax=Microbacterium sp. K35 TaxID=2305440 RepID=UPI00144474E5|nr:helix-turn-helix domain-containing protein [Microbacterium sp. K35]